MSQSELYAERKKRYTAVHTVSDDFGRVLSVMRLKPSQQDHIREMCPGLVGSETITGVDEETGQPVTREISRIFSMMVAASVRKIDDSPYTFPKSRADLDFIRDTLDDEGVFAAAGALLKASLEEAKLNVKEEAKNEAATQA